MAQAIETNLTLKQQNFCHEYVKNGGNGVRAYLEAYNSKSETAARHEASKLLKRDDITDYLQTLLKPTQNKIINEREKKRTILWRMIEDENVDNSDKLRAMDILNKIDQEYVTITRDETKTDISKLDNDTLLKLATS